MALEDITQIKITSPQSVTMITTGTRGRPGATWHSVTGIPPNELGVDGDFALSRDTGDVWQKQLGVYVFQLNLVGQAIGGGNGVISGGQVIWQQNYDYNVSPCTYRIQGVMYDSPETLITLDAAHSTLDRIDVIAVNTSGNVIKITGVPSANPVEPTVNTATQLKLTIVFVLHGTTEPGDSVITNIYRENAGHPNEWVWSTSGGTWDLASTSNPRTGTKCIEATALTNGSFVKGLKGASGSFIITTYNTWFVLNIRSKATWNNNRSLRIQFFNNDVAVASPVSLANGAFGFDSSNTSNYQQIAIAIWIFAVTLGTEVDEIRLTAQGSGGSAIGFRLDDIFLLESGTVLPPQQGLDNLRHGGFTFGAANPDGVAVGQIKGFWTCPYQGTIEGWALHGNAGFTVKIWKRATGIDVLTTADRINNAGLTLGGVGRIRSQVTTDFTTVAVAVGDTFGVEITGITAGLTELSGSIEINKT